MFSHARHLTIILLLLLCNTADVIWVDLHYSNASISPYIKKFCFRISVVKEALRDMLLKANTWSEYD